MNRTKVAIVVSQMIEKVEMLIGCFSLFCGFSMLLIIPEEKDDIALVIGCLIFFAALGIILIVKARKRKKLRISFKKYVAVISKDSTGVIENIASAMGNSADQCKDDLKRMINLKFFADAYIDESNNQIVIPSITKKESQPQQADVEYKVCTCPNCGGINKIIKGKTAECDFCGSPLS